MLPFESIQRDDSIYPKADTFDPHRFLSTSSTRSIFNQADNIKETNQNHETKSKSSATLDEAFLGFGFGKHACPGRFFAINEMKIFMAYLIQHYDVEFIMERPEPVSVIWLKYPLDKVKIRVRRRATCTCRYHTEMT
jgi:cytochrome P450